MSSLLRSMKPLHSNLECFLDCVTPTVPSQHLPKSCIRDLNSLWNQQNKEVIEYFTLGDLWNCYDEWSAYGIGAPVALNTGESVVQYYVPYLSAIQIYTSKSMATLRSPSPSTRSPREESSDHAEFETDSWSDDSEGEKLSRSPSNASSKFWDAMSEDSSFEHEPAWPMRDRLGFLYHQYFEMSAPYWRIPLLEKVTEMARTYPGLMTLRSVDLSPASWMAVAWYPIYHIPAGKQVKDLSACFLTFHTLSSSFQDPIPEDDEKDISSEGGEEGKKSSSGIPLYPFGLATYKMQGDVWLHPETVGNETYYNLTSAADSWLKQLRVQHHDFNYFAARATTPTSP